MDIVGIPHESIRQATASVGVCLDIRLFYGPSNRVLPSAFGLRPSAFGIRHSAFGIRHSAFGIRHSAFGIDGAHA
ncbi:hypothetical protein WS91_30765 [Burkholderia sp. MSMB1498]|nr:hypothetical protein WS91_30765 [Burkholderia sp. MSMB1498]